MRKDVWQGNLEQQRDAGARGCFSGVLQGDEADSAATTGCCRKSFNCTDAKWTLIRFAGLCLLAVLILCAVYGVKGKNKEGHHRR